MPLLASVSDDLVWPSSFEPEGVRAVDLPGAWRRNVARLSAFLSGGRLLPLLAASIWEVQSYLATAALYGLLVLTSMWLTLPVMLAWSLLATVVFFHGRKRGLPDLLKDEPLRSEQRWGLLGNLSLYAGRIWLVGIQAFLYSRTFCRVLDREPTRCRRSRLAQKAVLGVGLTLFGVTATHHMLSRAGYAGGKLLTLGMVGSICNVTYRVLLSAAVVGAVTQVMALAVRS